MNEKVPKDTSVCFGYKLIFQSVLFKKLIAHNAQCCTLFCLHLLLKLILFSKKTTEHHSHLRAQNLSLIHSGSLVALYQGLNGM